MDYSDGNYVSLKIMFQMPTEGVNIVLGSTDKVT